MREWTIYNKYINIYYNNIITNLGKSIKKYCELKINHFCYYSLDATHYNKSREKYQQVLHELKINHFCYYSLDATHYNKSRKKYQQVLHELKINHFCYYSLDATHYNKSKEKYQVLHEWKTIISVTTFWTQHITNLGKSINKYCTNEKQSFLLLLFEQHIVTNLGKSINKYCTS